MTRVSRQNAFISNDDIFKVFKQRYNVHSSAYLSEYQNLSTGIYFDTIVQLESLEKALEKIAGNGAFNVQDYELALAQGNKAKLKKIIQFFNSLRIDQKLFDLGTDDFKFSAMVMDFYQFLTKVDNPFFITTDKLDWTVATFPKEPVFTCIQQYLLSKLSDGHVTTYRNNVLNEECIEVFNYVDGLLAKTKILYLLLLNIKIFSTENNDSKTAQQIMDKHFSLFDLDEHLAGFPWLLSRFLSVEIGLRNSLKLDVLLIFEAKEPIDVLRFYL